MATAQGTETGLASKATSADDASVKSDKAEGILRTIDQTTKGSTGISLFHILTIGSIGASIALFLSGRKDAGIFVGLWPPTFQALKAAVENKDRAS